MLAGINILVVIIWRYSGTWRENGGGNVMVPEAV